MISDKMQLRSGRTVGLAATPATSSTAPVVTPAAHATTTASIQVKTVDSDSTPKCVHCGRVHIKIANSNTIKNTVVHYADKKTFLVEFIKASLGNVELTKGKFLKTIEAIKIYEVIDEHFDYINSNDFSVSKNFIETVYGKCLELEKDSLETENPTEKAIADRFKIVVQSVKQKAGKVLGK